MPIEPTNTTFGVEVDNALDWVVYDRLPSQVRNYLANESPLDYSAEDVLDHFRMWPSGIGAFIQMLRASALRELNENRDAGWPVCRSFTPLRRRNRLVNTRAQFEPVTERMT